MDKYQFVWWWGFHGPIWWEESVLCIAVKNIFPVRWRRITGSMGKIYRWSFRFGPLEVRRWA